MLRADVLEGSRNVEHLGSDRVDGKAREVPREARRRTEVVVEGQAQLRGDWKGWGKGGG